MIAISFQEDVHLHLLQDKYNQEAMASQFDTQAPPAELIKAKNTKRVLDTPDFVYRGLLFSDGVTD